MPATHLALLRGINVGGKNILPMKELAKMFADEGCTDVRTYIQSGNVIFNAPLRLAGRIPVRIAARIEKRFGYRTHLILRTVEQLRIVAARNPFLKVGVDKKWLHVMFLAELPDPGSARGLDSKAFLPDAFMVCGREVYLHLPNGGARTKLNNHFFDSKLATTSTVRNWRTVTTLFEWMQS
jgi:uncharacterized protein (DUF1697 family)